MILGLGLYYLNWTRIFPKETRGRLDLIVDFYIILSIEKHC